MGHRVARLRAPLANGEPRCEAKGQEERRAESDERKPLAVPRLIYKGTELAETGRAAGHMVEVAIPVRQREVLTSRSQRSENLRTRAA